jgi:predicted ABC-type transport system involved in lysophospholipase L1 biosynthesis ATPase subunit
MGEPVLRLESVAQGFCRGPDHRLLLRGVSLTVGEGEFVGLLGGRGEGKTTLLRIAAGVDSPEAGSVWFEGRDLAGCSGEERAALLGSCIAWMPRGDFGGFDSLDYIALPLVSGGRRIRAAEERALAALERVGAGHCARLRWEELFAWDRLLVACARGYATCPRLMVVDDLLDALGASETRRAGELLLSFTREFGCGVLAGASDIGALLAADRVVHLDGEGGLSNGDQAGPLTTARDFPRTTQTG